MTGLSDESPSAQYIPETLVQLVDPLDEPEFYCLDVPGFGASLQLDSPLMTHTCKRNGPEDEIFSYDPASGRFHMPAYGLCMEADRPERGGQLGLVPCSDSPLQDFRIGDEGLIRLADTDLCLTMADGAGEPTGGPSHLRRGLSLESCTAPPTSLNRWRLPGTVPG